MHKILDTYNNRGIKLNTNEGALTAASILLETQPTRLAHTMGVVRSVQKLLIEVGVDSVLYDKCIQSAYLHDIGYAEGLNFSKFPPFDGYYYLKENRWDETVYKTALFHSYALELMTMSRLDLIREYNKEINNTHEELFVSKVITWADLRTLLTGEETTYDGRVKEVGNRHGLDSVEYKHLETVRGKYDKLLFDIRVMAKDKQLVRVGLFN